MMWHPMFWLKLRKVGRAIVSQVSYLATVVCAIGVFMMLSGVTIATPDSLQLSIDALHQQDFAAAVKHLDQALDEGREPNQIYGHRCLANLMLNAFQQAIQDCSAGIQLRSGQPKLHFYRGVAQYRLADFAAAIADFTEHLRAHPEDARAFYNRGLASFAQGQVPEAIADYHNALIYAAGLHSIEMSNLYNDLGIAYLSSAKPTEALLALDQAIAMDAHDPRAYFNHGCVCHDQGHYAAALVDFDHVLRLNPTHAEALLNRGLSKEQLGDRSGAISDFQAAIDYFQQQSNALGMQQAKLALQHLQSLQDAFA